MHSQPDAGRKRDESAVVHNSPAIVALVQDHFFPHSSHISLWCFTASAKAVFTVGPMTRPHVQDAEYMM